MTEVVVATLNVNFSAESEGTGGSIKLEIDDREDGLNGGDTSFAPGDDAYFFLFKDANVTLITDIPERTAGGVTSASSATKVVDEYLTFSNSDTSSLGYPPDGSVTMTWQGRSYQLSVTTLSTNTALPEVSGSELRMAGGKKVIGILRCQYDSTGSLWKLSNVPEDIADVLVFAIGTVG
jgi:hypothetical protein